MHKILIPVTYFGPQGGFRVLSELANHWLNMGCQVEFLAYRGSPTPSFPTNAAVTWYDNDGNTCIQNDLNGKRPRLKILWILRALTKAINKREYDIVLANQSLSAFPVYFSKACEKKFYYIQAYEPDYYAGHTFNKRVLRMLSRESYKLPLNKIVNAPIYFNYKEIKASRFVFPGIDFTKFKPGIKGPANKIILGCIGRIEPFKGTSFVLEAYHQLRNEFGPAIELHIAFGNKQLESVEQGIRIITVKNDIELAAYYNSASIIIAPGTIQLGAVHYPVIEAMACKTPVVTTGYHPADSNNSWIVPIKNSILIAEAVKNIISNPEATEKKVEKAFAEVQEFDWNIVAKKMLTYFNSPHLNPNYSA